MTKHTLTAAALAVVLAAPAFAQSTTPGTQPKAHTQSQMNSNATVKDNMTKSNSTVGQTSATSMDASAPNFVQNQQSTDWRGSKLIGASVYGQGDTSIGDINDVVVASDGQINAVVIGVGGFLGVGEKNVAIPFERLTITRKPDSASIDKITVAYSKDELKNAPKFAYYEASGSSSTTGAATTAPTTDKNAPLAPSAGGMKK